MKCTNCNKKLIFDEKSYLKYRAKDETRCFTCLTDDPESEIQLIEIEISKEDMEYAIKCCDKLNKPGVEIDIHETFMVFPGRAKDGAEVDVGLVGDDELEAATIEIHFYPKDVEDDQPTISELDYDYIPSSLEFEDRGTLYMVQIKEEC